MKQDKNADERNDRMALDYSNYRLMLIGFAVIVLGFVLMTGGASSSADEFDYSMFNFRRITLAPILVLGGFAFEIYAIMKNFKSKK